MSRTTTWQLLGEPPVTVAASDESVDTHVENETGHPWIAEGAGRLRFGIFGGPMDDIARLAELVRTAERLGADSYWIPDHPLHASDWATMLSALAVRSEHIRLGTLVVCPYYRSAVVLARQ